MGIFDFVKSGTQELCIARPDPAKQFIVYKHPDQTIPMYAQLTVDSDECAVFFKDGKVMGILGPGRHTLQTSNIPFLSNLVDKFTGGNMWISEVFFVKTAPQRDLKFGGPVNRLRDPETGLTISPRVFGSFVIQVVDPATFIVQYVGQAAAGQNEDVLKWVSEAFLQGARSGIGLLFKSKELNFLDIAASQKVIGDRMVRECPELQSIGLRVLSCFPTLNFSEEDEKKIAEFADADANILLEQKKGMAEAARQQAKIDQQFNKDARYVQQLAGNYNNYAAGQAMMGAGQGMAQGGGNAGVALMGAQMAAGVGMANAIGGGMYGQGQQPGYGQPQFQPQFQGGAPNPQAPQQPQQAATPAQAAGGMVTCGGCKANVPMGKFCQECGGTLASKKFCTGCGGELTGGAKFCAGCGTKAP